jgi:hypothetical protein
MKIVHQNYIYESVRGFMRDDWLYVDPLQISDKEYKDISNRLKGEGYDVRGVPDLKKIMDSYHKENIDGTTYVKIRGEDWSKIIGGILKIVKPEKKVVDKNLLNVVLQNIEKDPESGIKIGETLTSGTAYILPDGRTINFATSFGSRADDHRIISSYTGKDFSSTSEGMQYFMDNTGAIRFVPESPAFDIRVPPTSIQLSKINSAVNNASGKEIGLDVYSPKFGRKGKWYSAGTPGKRIQADISRFYASGEFGLEHVQ